MLEEVFPQKDVHFEEDMFVFPQRYRERGGLVDCLGDLGEASVARLKIDCVLGPVPGD